ncbi:hypothetical protein TNCV_1234801 [Trichonephila clavipes]|nr:hypothetical protein TNCV_1234801 [Trichonephila clavipes]
MLEQCICAIPLNRRYCPHIVWSLKAQKASGRCCISRSMWNFYSNIWFLYFWALFLFLDFRLTNCWASAALERSLLESLWTDAGGEEFLLNFRGPVWQGLPKIQQPVVASGEPPALQCRTPSRHHLELQDRRDYTPADRAARTCWLGCPGLLYYLAARDVKLSFSLVPSTWPLPPRSHLTSPKILKSSKPHSKCQFSQGAVRCVIIPIVKTHQTQLHSTQSWSATGLRGRKIKIS